MEEQSKKDVKRIVALLATFLSIATLGIVTFSQGSSNSITGGAVATGNSAFAANTWIIATVATIVLVAGAVTLFKLDR